MSLRQILIQTIRNNSFKYNQLLDRSLYSIESFSNNQLVKFIVLEKKFKKMIYTDVVKSKGLDWLRSKNLLSRLKYICEIEG